MMRNHARIWFLICIWLVFGANAVSLRGFRNDIPSLWPLVEPSSFLSLSTSTGITRSGEVDWWLWIVIGGLVVLAGFVTFVFRKPSGDKVLLPDAKLTLSTEILSCQQIVTRSSPQIDPVQLGVTVRGKSATGEFIDLFHELAGHETASGSTKFAWDVSDFNWMIQQPVSLVGPQNELIIQLEQYSTSGGLIAVVATGIVTLKPPVVGSVITPRPAIQLVELISTSSSGSVWGNIEVSMKYDLVKEETTEQLELARKQIYRKLRVAKPLFMASHSLAFVLIILDSFLGIRYLFSGCFTSSIHAMVSAGLIALLSVPMAAEWGQMHYKLPSWAIKIGKLNSQFKATVLLLCAIPQIIIAPTTGARTCSPFFETTGALTFLDFLLFSILFVQSEANGHIAAMFHFNCFKRPLPPALASSKGSSSETVSTTEPLQDANATPSPSSYAARRAARQQSVDIKK